MSNAPNISIESQARARIIVIDDDPQIRSLLTSFLRRDYLVSVAADGEEGYNKALEHTPDIAIIDVNMPHWDGLQTLRAFRSHLALRDVRILMLTADSSRQTVMAAIAHGADDYIVKTALSKDDLLAKIKRARGNTVAVPQPHLMPTALTQNQIAEVVSSHATAPKPHVELNGNGKEHAPEEAQASKLQEIMDSWE
jgi:DNA-binding response OmpR family regulator